MYTPVEPIDILELFLPLGRELARLLRSLTPQGWLQEMICAPWTVKDLAAHLLGGSLGRVWTPMESAERAASGGKISQASLGYADLLERINRRNALWVEAARLVGPGMLVELLETSDLRLYAHFRSLDPFQPARCRPPGA